MSTSPPSKTWIALVAVAISAGLAWWALKEVTPSLSDVSKPNANHGTLMLRKPIPIGFAKATFATAKQDGTDNAILTYTRVERAKPSVSHKLHARNGLIVADEYLFERTNSGPLVSEAIVADLGLSDANWTGSSLTVLDWRAMKLKDVPLFTTSKDTFEAALYEADGVARLVVCNGNDPSSKIADFVVNASLPDAGVQEGLKQADRELSK